jgi:hypothetical protein
MRTAKNRDGGVGMTPVESAGIARQPWHRPTLRAISVAGAELGPNTNPDGAFTQS